MKKKILQLQNTSAVAEIVSGINSALTVHYRDSLAIECTSVVRSFLRCIVGLNEYTREHPLRFRTPLKMVVPSNSALFKGIEV